MIGVKFGQHQPAVEIVLRFFQFLDHSRFGLPVLVAVHFDHRAGIARRDFLPEGQRNDRLHHRPQPDHAGHSRAIPRQNRR